MSIEEEYENLDNDIDTDVIRRYMAGGYIPSAGLVLSLCAEIDALERSEEEPPAAARVQDWRDNPTITDLQEALGVAGADIAALTAERDALSAALLNLLSTQADEDSRWWAARQKALSVLGEAGARE